MSAEMNDKDMMATFMGVLGILMLIAVIIFFVSRLAATVDNNSTEGTGSSMADELVNERIARIGSVTAVDKSIAPKARTGEEVYNTVCLACHGTGALGAPMSADDWAPRLKLGLDQLVTSAINGVGQMPARGGDPSLTDDEIRKAIEFMTK